jgi:hypothetical protein
MSHRLSSETWADKQPTTYRPLIHILDDDSLLNIFSLCRPALSDESEVYNANDHILEGREWSRKHWWHRLIQVCRRWRYIVLESASHLRLSLVCARGSPIADMLTYSPLPLLIDHFDKYHDMTAEDEKGILLALQHRDRVRRIRLRKSLSTLQRLIYALDGEFPILEYLLIEPQKFQWPFIGGTMNLPNTFRAPRLRHLLLMSFDFLIESPLFTTTASLVTLSLDSIPPSAYFNSNALLQRVSLMPQLEILDIFFIQNLDFPRHDIERQLLRTPIMTRVTLPNLRCLGFKGANTYLESLLCQVTIPLLKKLQVYFFKELTYSIPRLQQFMSTAEIFRPNVTTFTVHHHFLEVTAYPHKGAKMYTLSISLGGQGLDWQIASAAQVCRALRTIFSSVEHLTIKYYGVNRSSWSVVPDRTQWRELLGSFVNVKTLFVGREYVGQLSGALQPGGGESPTELLPELQELSCPAIYSSVNAFTPFIDARQRAGSPVTLIRVSESRPYWALSG